MKATIDSQGRIELPHDLQLQLGVRPGEEVTLESRWGECVITPARAAPGLCLEGNVLVHRAVAPSSPDAGLTNLREERFEQLAEGLSR